MMKRYLLPASPLAAMLLLTGCMDDNYDLANIDTTTQVNVNGLVIPVNLKDVTLNSILDLDEESDIKKETDPITGKQIYVYSYKGDFDSDAINVDPFNVDAPEIAPGEIEVHLSTAANAPAKRVGADAIHYTVSEYETTFDYFVSGIDSAVKKITSLTTPKMVFDTKLLFPRDITNSTSNIHAVDLRIQFPKGLKMAAGSPSIGTYDGETGIVTISDYDIQNGVLALEVVSTRLLVDETIENEAFTYNNAITVLEGGQLMLTPKNGETLASYFTLTTDYKLDAFKVTAFCGELDKPIEGLEINPIELNALPDFLTGEGTNLILNNPQLYLELNNPVSQYNLEAHTGLALTPVRPNTQEAAITLPKGLTIGKDKPTGAVYKYALSPEGTSLKPIEGFENAEKLPYPGLGHVLAGDGIPEKLKVDFDNPNVYGNDVVEFPLNGNISGITGNYIFRAPLALEEGTTIYYSGTKNDWSSEDLDRLNVNVVELTATVTSDVPLAVELTAQIINTAQEHLGKAEPAAVPANAKDYPITLKVVAPEGSTIKNIDGIFYQAICAVTPDNPSAGEPLSPDQKIILKDLRAKVTGFYLYEDK